MACPILEQLKKGERFPTSMLLNERDSVKLYWEWWWENAPKDQLTRPHTIAEDDPWLTHTINKQTVDTETYREYLSAFALNLQRIGELRRGCQIPRQDYRSDLVKHVVSKATHRDAPVIILTGGGYGAGKTTAVDILVRTRQLPINRGSLTGVDYFKAYFPEYSTLQNLAEGSASTVVQEESRLVADQVYTEMIDRNLSFGWDSSMSNGPETIKRLKKAKEKGYELIQVAVFAPVELAIRQAMIRAKQSKRFAHPEFLPKSHTDFRKNFPSYLEFFDKVYAFVNDGTLSAKGEPNMHLVATKPDINTKLATHIPDLFDKFVA